MRLKKLIDNTNLDLLTNSEKKKGKGYVFC